MGYLKIPNLYSEPQFLLCYALEKVHGTSAHINWDKGNLKFFSGGEKYDNFIGLFNHSELKEKFKSYAEKNITVYGEAFGGKQQNMSHAYGKNLRFICFDVKIDEVWLNVESAEHFVRAMGLDFVPYSIGPFTKEFVDQERDKPSLVAVVENAIREGIVVRPYFESQQNNGKRTIFKHKRPEFSEHSKPREISFDKAERQTAANLIADDWVVPMRLEHILQKTPYNSPADTKKVIDTMINDVRVEGENEIVWSNDVAKAIGTKTVELLRKFHNLPMTNK